MKLLCFAFLLGSIGLAAPAVAAPPSRCDAAAIPWAAEVWPSAWERCAVDQLRERCSATDACLVACWTSRADVVRMPDGATMPIGGGCDHLCNVGDSTDVGPPSFETCDATVDERPKRPGSHAPGRAGVFPPLPPQVPPDAWTAQLLEAVASGRSKPLWSAECASQRLSSCGGLHVLSSERFGPPVLVQARQAGDRRVVAFDKVDRGSLLARAFVLVDHDQVDGMTFDETLAADFLDGMLPARPGPRTIPGDAMLESLGWSLLADGTSTPWVELRSTVEGSRVGRTWRVGDMGVICFERDANPWLARFERKDGTWTFLESFRGYRTCSVDLMDLVPDLVADARRTASLGDPIIMGALDRAVMNDVILGDMTGIASCFTGASDVVVRVEFRVGKDGAVSAVSIAQTLLPDAVRSCVVDRFSKLRFPAPKGGGIVIATYPVSWRL